MVTMDADVATPRERRAFALVVVVAMTLLLATWMPAPLSAVSTVLFQGMPAWLR
jgi:hypothetical protein